MRRSDNRRTIISVRACQIRNLLLYVASLALRPLCHRLYSPREPLDRRLDERQSIWMWWRRYDPWPCHEQIPSRSVHDWSLHWLNYPWSEIFISNKEVNISVLNLSWNFSLQRDRLRGFRLSRCLLFRTSLLLTKTLAMPAAWSWSITSSRERVVNFLLYCVPKQHSGLERGQLSRVSNLINWRPSSCYADQQSVLRTCKFNP